MQGIDSKTLQSTMVNAFTLFVVKGPRLGVYMLKRFTSHAARRGAHKPSLRGCRPWQSMAAILHGSPRRCAPRDDELMQSIPKRFAIADRKKEIFL
jgi:hypothetical protein